MADAETLGHVLLAHLQGAPRGRAAAAEAAPTQEASDEDEEPGGLAEPASSRDGGFASNKPSAPITGINVTPAGRYHARAADHLHGHRQARRVASVAARLAQGGHRSEVQQVFALSLKADGGTFVDGNRDAA